MSKFTGLPRAAKNNESEGEVETLRPALIKAARGRPKGKRSDPDYEQVTAYIRKKTYKQTKLTLLQIDDKRDFSQLIEDLLSAYPSTQNSK